MSTIGYQKLYSRKRSRKHNLVLSSIPSIRLDDASAAKRARYFYHKYQILHLSCQDISSQEPMKLILSIINQYPDIISKSLTVEHGNGSSSLEDVKALLSHHPSISSHQAAPSSWYMSFILQDNEDLLQHFIQSEIYRSPPFFPSDHVSSRSQSNAIDSDTRINWQSLVHTRPIWIFFGRNLSSEAYRGRVEHTDSVSHDGTWHRQVSGEKIWYLRPVTESKEWPYGPPKVQSNRNRLRKKSPTDNTIVKGDDLIQRLRIICRANDFLIINTRLWWHSTEIPNTQSATDRISLSYARDFYLRPSEVHFVSDYIMEMILMRAYILELR